MLKLTVQLAGIAFFLLISGCTNTKYHDPSLKTSQESYEANLTSPIFDDAPDFVPAPYKDETWGEAFHHPLKLSVSGEISIHELIHKIASLGQINLISRTKIPGNIFINTHNETPAKLLSKIAKVSDLAYEIDGNSLHVLPDEPYTKTYEIQFLNVKRHKDSSMVIGTDIFSGPEGGANMQTGASAINGSTTKISGETTLDFWQELDTNIKSILFASHIDPKKKPNQARFSLHKQAGLLTLTAPHKQHQLVREYLAYLRRQTNAQVLIEAKIIEVNLNDSFQGGIDWQAIRQGFVGAAPFGKLAIPAGYKEPNAPGARNVFSLGGAHKNISGFMRLLKTFGTVRTLSNPRLTALNNNAAIFKAATNHVFFRVHYNRETRSSTRPDVERASSEIHTVPIGLIMTVHPAIDLTTGRITLNLRPTITRITNEVEDPAVGILTAAVKSSMVPEVQVREIDSIIQIHSGEVIVLGGLMEERADNHDARTPIPGIENVMRAKDDQRQITELVILLRAYILPDGKSSYNKADERVYTKFTKDPRRIRLSRPENKHPATTHAKTS